MAKYTGWKKRYSYLNNYKKGMDGKYVYYGRHYVYQGDLPIRQYKGLLGIMDILLAGLFIVGGFLDAGIIWNTWYVLIPYALEAVAVFLMLWKTLSLVLEKVPLKDYIYKRTVPWFRPLGLVLAVLNGLSLVGTGICMLVYPDQILMTGCVIYLITKALMGCAAVLFTGRISKYSWAPDPSEEPLED